MSWESERPNIILTLENIDEIEEIYNSASKLLEGISFRDYYVIKSHDPDWVYGISRAKNIFKALKRIMADQNYSDGKDREYINHWRWIPRLSHYANEEKPRSEGGYLTHYYNSRYPNDEEIEHREFSKLSEMNQHTIDHWNEMNSKLINPPFYRGGDPYRKLGIGMKVQDLWWCESNRSIGFSKRTKKDLILEI